MKKILKTLRRKLQTKKREIVYKRVKTLAEHCNVCGERLSGNNSQILPYECKCGTWEYDWEKAEFYIE